MKNYTTTANGKAYAVTVEKGVAPGIATTSAAPVTAPTAPAVPTAAPVPVAAPADVAGSVSVSTLMSGKVVAVKAAAGQAVKKGDVTPILEAVKMENDIMAPQDGTIASINASTGDSVEFGAILATLNQLER